MDAARKTAGENWYTGTRAVPAMSDMITRAPGTSRPTTTAMKPCRWIRSVQRRIDVDPRREPVRHGRTEAPRQEVRHERSKGGREGADEHHLRELGKVAARAITVERDDDVGRRGQRDTGLLDRDHEEEDDVLMLEHREKEEADRVADDRRQAHGGRA